MAYEDLFKNSRDMIGLLNVVITEILEAVIIWGLIEF